MIAKLRSLFISSFRWRILINVTLSYIIATAVSSIVDLGISLLKFIHISDNANLLLNYVITFGLFISIFFKLMNITLRYINSLNKTIQDVTLGDYDARCEIEYDDELGMLAANINALSNTLHEKEKEANILRENEQLAYEAERNAEKQKNDLITNVAHDLRTPLTSVIGYLDLIGSSDNLSHEDIINYAHIAYNKSLRLKSMMDDLFEFTKLDNAKIKMNLNIINLSELILQLTDEYTLLFQEHAIEPILSIKDHNLYVIGDGQLLARVFDNLFSNALKYGYDHSQLKVEVIGDEKAVTIKIMNEGDTISKEDLPYIFDKFYRADTARSTNAGGTGLGLAIAKNIVEMHKGQIFMTSHDHITTFIVQLPRHIKKEKMDKESQGTN